METSSLTQTKITKQKLRSFNRNSKNNHIKSKKNITRNNNHHFHNDHKRDHHKFHQTLAVNHRNHRRTSSRVSFCRHGRFNVSRCPGKPAEYGNDNAEDNAKDVVTGHSRDSKAVDNDEESELRLSNKSSCNNGRVKNNGTLLINGCIANEDGLKSKVNGVGDVDDEDNVKDTERKNELANGRHDELIVGNFTREVYNAICLRLGDTLHIPEASVKELFNDMHLFPSDIQVTKMLQCARQYTRRNGTNHNYLTFGEFCVFVREMQSHQNPRSHRKLSQQKVNNNKCPNNKCDVFLGGSCNPTTWRADTAIPELQKYGISFYNPQVSIWAPELLAQEHDAKQSASVLLFVIDSQTRSTVGMVEVAYLVACGRCVVVVAQPYRIGQSIMGETITDREYYDLVQGQKSLLDLLKSKGVQIHRNLPTALQCTADILRNISVSGTTSEEQVTYKLRRLREVYDSYNGQMHIYDVIDAYRRLTNRSLEISKLYNYLNLQNGNVANYSTTVNGVGNCGHNGVNCGNGTTLSFEKFCAVMAELSTDGCGMCNVEAWATQTFARNQQTQYPTAQNRTNCAVDASQAASQIPASQERVYDVYLGGSLSTGTKWREDIAEPLLKKHGVQYYNPAIRDQSVSSIDLQNSTSLENHTETWQDDMTRWRQEIGQCSIALFVITNDTRSLTSMILAAHYIGSGKEVVLSIEQLNSENCTVSNETLTKNAIKDYNRARAYLKDLAERRQIQVFDSPEQAVKCVLSKLSKSSSTGDADSRTELNR